MGYKYALKDIIKLVTVEGEHTYLVLVNTGPKVHSNKNQESSSMKIK